MWYCHTHKFLKSNIMQLNFHLCELLKKMKNFGRLYCTCNTDMNNVNWSNYLSADARITLLFSNKVCIIAHGTTRTTTKVMKIINNKHIRILTKVFNSAYAVQTSASSFCATRVYARALLFYMVYIAICAQGHRGYQDEAYMICHGMMESWFIY